MSATFLSLVLQDNVLQACVVKNGETVNTHESCISVTEDMSATQFIPFGREDESKVLLNIREVPKEQDQQEDLDQPSYTKREFVVSPFIPTDKNILLPSIHDIMTQPQAGFAFIALIANTIQQMIDDISEPITVILGCENEIFYGAELKQELLQKIEAMKIVLSDSLEHSIDSIECVPTYRAMAVQLFEMGDIGEYGSLFIDLQHQQSKIFPITQQGAIKADIQTLDNCAKIDILQGVQAIINNKIGQPIHLSQYALNKILKEGWLGKPDGSNSLDVRQDINTLQDKFCSTLVENLTPFRYQEEFFGGVIIAGQDVQFISDKIQNEHQIAISAKNQSAFLANAIGIFYAKSQRATSSTNDKE